MNEAVILDAVRTPIGTVRKGTLRDTRGEQLAEHVLSHAMRRSGLPPERLDDVIFAESHYGGGDLARYAAVAAGLDRVPGQAVNRYCAGGLTAVSNAAGQIMSGMEHAIIAGGVNAGSMSPRQTWRIPGSDETETRSPRTFPHRPDATDDTTLTVGWNIAQKYGLSREDMDRWAVRSHQRAIAAIDAGVFDSEIAPIDVTVDGQNVRFAVDEHPRRDTSLEAVAKVRVVHPEIEGFSITAANAAGGNDGAAALTLTSREVAAELGREPLCRIRAWASVGVDPKFTGDGSLAAISKVLDKAGLGIEDVDLWEINEAMAAVPLSVCRELGIDDERVNIYGSGCSLGHPIGATGARMLTTLAHELHRRGGGIAVAAMCAGGGQGGAVVMEA